MTTIKRDFMHAQTSRARTRSTTMSHRPMHSKPQKEESRRFSAHYRQQTSPLSSRSPCSPPYNRARAHHNLQSSTSLHEPHLPMMPITIFAALRRWLLEKGFEGYIRVAEAPPDLEALDIAKKLNVDTVTNATIWKKLGLSAIGEKHFDISPAQTLEKYFGEYSTSAKAYRTKDIPNPFF